MSLRAIILVFVSGRAVCWCASDSLVIAVSDNVVLARL